MQDLDPREIKPRLTSGEEIAFIDVREYGQYGEGHPFFAVNLPYSRLELAAEARMPCKSAPVVLLDDGDGVAEKAARRLAGLGFSNVGLSRGGAPGWEAAGFTLFKGVNLPSKAFGEVVEEVCHTPRLTAQEFEARRSGGEKLVLLDGRTPEEFRKMTIPGSVSCPNAELGHRLPAFVSDDDTTIVVNCAGRTRSIIGAQSLRHLGVKNPVYALENGTQGWELAGFELERGATRSYPREISPEAEARSREAAATLRAENGIPAIDRATLDAWRADGSRSLYVLDVRTAEEYEAGHLADARHAPGGQLVQATDRWVAVRGARIVLTDDTGLRAAGTALWLRAMGHDACVLDADLRAEPGLTLGAPAVTSAPSILPGFEPGDLERHLAAGGALVDLNPGMAYRDAHIAGAQWGIRPRLEALGLEKGQDIVLAATPGVAELAAIDLRELGCENLHHLAGGPDDWRAAGLDLVATPDQPGDANCIDYLFFVHDRHDGN
ncbi:MAG: rhodanese-like domain-containing protein, partial [Methyloligellaceae bacterium]